MLHLGKELVTLMATHTVTASSMTPEALVTLAEFASELPAGTARDVITVATEILGSGRDMIIVDADSTVTPSQAAKILGISRAHLYKVLDSGALPFTVVGKRDRRIAMSDFRDYLIKTEALRWSTARQAARSRATRVLAIDEM